MMQSVCEFRVRTEAENSAIPILAADCSRSSNHHSLRCAFLSDFRPVDRQTFVIGDLRIVPLTSSQQWPLGVVDRHLVAIVPEEF